MTSSRRPFRLDVLLSHPFIKLAPFYVTNLAVPSLVNRSKKDELQCLGTLCGRDQRSKTILMPFSSQSLAIYVAEMRQVIERMANLHLSISHSTKSCVSGSVQWEGTVAPGEEWNLLLSRGTACTRKVPVWKPAPPVRLRAAGLVLPRRLPLLLGRGPPQQPV